MAEKQKYKGEGAERYPEYTPGKQIQNIQPAQPWFPSKPWPDQGPIGSVLGGGGVAPSPMEELIRLMQQDWTHQQQMDWLFRAPGFEMMKPMPTGQLSAPSSLNIENRVGFPEVPMRGPEPLDEPYFNKLSTALGLYDINRPKRQDRFDREVIEAMPRMGDKR